MSMTNDEIHDAVREQYGALARRVGEKPAELELNVQQPQASSCCGPSDSTEATDCGCGTPQLYDAQMLIDLPDNVTNLSAGCGDPVTIAGLQPGETVLDLGSGGGIDCFLAAQRVGDEGFVIGVDMTQDMLDQANTNKLKIGANNVEFRKGQIEDLPVRDNTVDVIMSNCVINLSPDKPAVFTEAFRVLKPGGRVSVSDIVLEGEFSEKMRGDMQQWASCVVGAIDVNRYMGMMRDVGFEDVKLVDEVDIQQVEFSPETLDNLPDEAITVIQGKGEKDLPRVFSGRFTARKPM